MAFSLLSTFFFFKYPNCLEQEKCQDYYVWHRRVYRLRAWVAPRYGSRITRIPARGTLHICKLTKRSRQRSPTRSARWGTKQIHRVTPHLLTPQTVLSFLHCLKPGGCFQHQLEQKQRQTPHFATSKPAFEMWSPLSKFLMDCGPPLDPSE